jgi:hypothetical protein
MPEPNTPMEMPDDGEESPNPMRADLLHWQRKAAKRAKAGRSPLCAFESEVIPAPLHAAIRGALELAQSAVDVREIFSALLDPDPNPAAVVWRGYP